MKWYVVKTDEVGNPVGEPVNVTDRVLEQTETSHVDENSIDQLVAAENAAFDTFGKNSYYFPA